MTKWLIACGFLLVGCDSNTVAPVKPEWERAIVTYRCTDAQMDRVHTQAEWCNKNTTYYSTYCYGAAIIRNCTKRQGENNA